MAEGRVIHKDSFRDEDGQVVTRIAYRFRTADGLSFEGRASQRGGQLAALRLGDKVWVLYSQSDPSRNRLAAGGPESGGMSGEAGSD